jgi:hypothetical protein
MQISYRFLGQPDLKSIELPLDATVGQAKTAIASTDKLNEEDLVIIQNGEILEADTPIKPDSTLSCHLRGRRTPVGSSGPYEKPRFEGKYLTGGGIGGGQNDRFGQLQSVYNGLSPSEREAVERLVAKRPDSPFNVLEMYIACDKDEADARVAIM